MRRSGPLRWAVIGVGIAGRARARAIEQDPRSRLVAVHRGRFAGDVSAPEVSFEEAIEAADAVAICSPSAAHPEQVRAALSADRHAVVEFPLASSAAEARALFALAEDRGRVLHVEHIEVLSGTTRRMEGAFAVVHSGAIEHRVRREHPVATADLGPLLVPRLHRLIAVAGPLAAARRTGVGPGLLECVVELARGGAVTLSVEAGPALRRSTRMRLVTDTGVWEQRDRELLHDGARVDLPDAPGLFAQDHAVAVDRIVDGAPGYLSDDAVVGVLEWVDGIVGSS